MGSERGFAIVFAAVFVIIATYPLLNGGAVRRWALATAAVFAVVGFVAPQILRVPNRLWFKFGLLLGAIVSPVVMAGVYYIVITPMGLIARPFRRRSASEDTQTHWKRRETPPQPFSRQF